MRRDNSRPPANLLWFVRSAYSLFCAHPYKSITSFIASLNLRPTLTHSTNSGFTDDNCTCQSTCPCKDARSCRTRCCYRIPPGLSDSSYRLWRQAAKLPVGRLIYVGWVQVMLGRMDKGNQVRLGSRRWWHTEQRSTRSLKASVAWWCSLTYGFVE